MVLAVMVAVPLLTVNLQKDSQDGPWIFRPFQFMSGLTQGMYSSFSFGVRNTTDLYLNLIDIKKNNRMLSEELAGLKTQLGKLNELQLENERLNKLLEFRQKTKMDLLAAKIIGRDLFADYDTVVVNRGSSHGVKKGMATITTAGSVGYVIEVEPFSSKLLLITDRNAVVDSVVQRSRARGILHGFTKDACLLKYLKRTDDVAVGDLIVTSGLDNIFPKGFPIGVVTEVEKDDYGFEQTVKVQPVVNSNNLEEVFVVLNTQNEDFETIASEEAPTEAAAVETEAEATQPAEENTETN